MKNKYEIRGDVTAIFISHKGNTIETIIDTEDLPKVQEKRNTWIAYRCRPDCIYVTINKPKVNGKRGMEILHRIIMDCPVDKVVDHINHNTLDNRKINLRNISMMENCQNLLGPNKANKTSGIRGVNWDKHSKKWRARSGDNNLGLYESLGEAADVAEKGRALYQSGSLEAITINIAPDTILHDRNKGYSTNKTGYRGVYWDKIRGKWKAQVRKKVDGKKKCVFFKYCDTVEEAAEAAKEARQRFEVK